MSRPHAAIAGLTGAAIVIALAAHMDAGQNAAPSRSTPSGDRTAQQAAAASSGARTPWGDPDLQGVWTNTTTTPLERLPEAAGKSLLSDEERKQVAQQVFNRIDQDKPRPGTVVPYNEFWYERGTLNNRTSLLVRPSDGRLPPFTPEAQKRWDATQAIRREGRADSWLDRSAYDRCITRGIPGAMMPGFYNHNYHILQAPGYVALVVEMIHDARIIPLDGRPHISPTIRQWLGDARGHWEGSTLVVETTNVNDNVFERGAAYGFGGDLRMIERFTRVGPRQLDYEFTIEAPSTFTAPWTVSTPMVPSDGPLYEYACHEGNYAMEGILGGARAAERAAGASPQGAR
jgi:hypothetical protein